MTFRQFELVRRMVRELHNRVSRKRAAEFNQLIFGSLCARRLVEYDAEREAFFVNEDGRRLFGFLEEWQPYRSHAGAFGVRAERAMHPRLRRVA